MPSGAKKEWSHWPPAFASWRQGATLDTGSWLAPKHGRTQAVVVGMAHLDDDERGLALIAFDEVYGYLPPHPQSPPTKRPLVALVKQARAFGVDVVATQNAMDLDYRALGNAGLWCIGRTQTDADREHVIDGSGGSGEADGPSKAELAGIEVKLSQRWFVVRNAYAKDLLSLLQPRWAMSLMLGPMTRTEIRQALGKDEISSVAPTATTELGNETPQPIWAALASKLFSSAASLDVSRTLAIM